MITKPFLINIKCRLMVIFLIQLCCTVYFLVKVLYHILVLVFFQHRNSQCRDDTPLKVQDSCCFTVLRVQFHIIQTLNHDPQGIPLKKVHSLQIYHFFFNGLNYHGEITYFSISAAKASELGLLENTGLPCVSVSTTSLSLQPVVRTMKLQVWGTSISTCERREISFSEIHGMERGKLMI